MNTLLLFLAAFHPYYGEGLNGLLKTAIIVAILIVSIILLLRWQGVSRWWERILVAGVILWLVFILIDFMF